MERIKTLALIACTKKKRAHALRAWKLYMASDWFAKARDYVGNRGWEWRILSAKHHVLHPDQVIEPYEETLCTMPIAQRRAWADVILMQLDELLAPKARVIVLAGELYRQFLEGPLAARGHTVEVPMRGLGLGEQKHWLALHLDDEHNEARRRYAAAFEEETKNG